MYKIKKIKNNIKIIYKKVDYLESINLGLFIKSGSIYENKNNNGISHLLEHMLFKGTTKRTAKKIASDTDKIGADINAYTTIDYTCLYMRCLSENIYSGIEILFDMINNLNLTNDDLEIEKQVIYDEIDNCNDDPEELAMSELLRLLFKDRDYRYNILGNKDMIKKMTKEELLDYKNKHYRGDNIVISIVGKFNEEELLKYIDKLIYPTSILVDNYKDINTPNMRENRANIKFIDRNFEQITGYINLGNKVKFDENKYKLMLLNNIFGGTISSKLFQKIREEKGLTYNINSFIYDNDYEANINIYFTCNNDNILEVNDSIIEEINNFVNYHITEEDLITGKTQLISELILNLEDPYEEMVAIGEELLLKNKIYNRNYIIDNIKSIGIDSLQKLKDDIFVKDSYNIIYVGNIDQSNKDKIKKYYF